MKEPDPGSFKQSLCFSKMHLACLIQGEGLKEKLVDRRGVRIEMRMNGNNDLELIAGGQARYSSFENLFLLVGY